MEEVFRIDGRMHCPTCQRAMRVISSDTGTGVFIQSFYCNRCDTSYTDRESVEAAVSSMKSRNKKWVISQLRIKGIAA